MFYQRSTKSYQIIFLVVLRFAAEFHDTGDNSGIINWINWDVTPQGPLIFNSVSKDSTCESTNCFEKETGTFTAPAQGQYMLWFTTTQVSPMFSHHHKSNWGGYGHVQLDVKDASGKQKIHKDFFNTGFKDDTYLDDGANMLAFTTWLQLEKNDKVNFSHDGWLWAAETYPMELIGLMLDDDL